MNSQLLSVENYFNTYDAEDNYSELVAIPGRTLQSREVNELQSIIHNRIDEIGNIVFNNGQVLSGCQVIVTGNILTIMEGRLFLNGKIYRVKKTMLPIRGVGLENICVKVVSSIVTAKEDKKLKDVAVGFDNYNEEGCERLKEELFWQVDPPDVESTIIFTLQNGTQINDYNNLSVNNNQNVTYDDLKDMLAKRTFEESGNYSIKGLTVEFKKQDEDYITLNVLSGKAYVQGYEVDLVQEHTLPVYWNDDTRKVMNETHLSTGKGVAITLNHKYCRNIYDVSGITEISANVTHTNILHGFDDLVVYTGNTPYAIVSVTDINGTTYKQGIDYKLSTNGRGGVGIEWILGGLEPNPGTTMYVVWQYSIVFSEYDYIKEENDGFTVLTFDSMVNVPVKDTHIRVTYDFLLYRYDSIVLDRFGKLYVIQGQSDSFEEVLPPTIDKDRYLELARVLIKPNFIPPTIINLNSRRITMSDLLSIYKRLDRLEQDVAISDLDREASSGEDATALTGILTDGFLGYTKADTNHPSFSAVIDSQNKCCTLDSVCYNQYINSGSGSTAVKTGDTYTLPYLETKIVEQPVASRTISFNEYGSFVKTPFVRITPCSDNWVGKVDYKIDDGGIYSTLHHWWDGNTLDKDVYMTTNDVLIEISNLDSYQDNIIVTFDNAVVNAVGTNATYTGTMSGTLKANRQGQSYGRIKVPENTLCGIKILSIYPYDKPHLVGTASYTCKGTADIEVPMVYKEKKADLQIMPIAQSFKFSDSDYILTSAGLFFKSKDNVNQVIVQVRTMYNGFPTNVVLAESVITPLAVKISLDGTTETKAVFNHPVFCHQGIQYCLVIYSMSTTDLLWAAATGDRDISRQLINKNVYIGGRLFTSSNGTSWVIEDKADLTFNLYRASFEKKGILNFNNIPASGANTVILMASQDLPQNTNIIWSYAANDSTSYLPINVNSEKQLNLLATSIKLRAELTTDNTNVSPAIAADSLVLGLFKGNGDDGYVTRNITLPDPYNFVKVTLGVKADYHNFVKVYYATDKDGNSWTEIPNVATDAATTDTDYIDYIYEATLPDVAKHFRLMITMSTTAAYKMPYINRLRCILSEQ